MNTFRAQRCVSVPGNARQMFSGNSRGNAQQITAEQ